MFNRFLGLAGLLFLVTACDEASVPRAPEVGSLAPEYSAVTMSGDSAALAQHQGEVVLLNVWATWCLPCREEIPALQRLHERFGEQGLRIVRSSSSADAGERERVHSERLHLGRWHTQPLVPEQQNFRRISGHTSSSAKRRW